MFVAMLNSFERMLVFYLIHTFVYMQLHGPEFSRGNLLSHTLCKYTAPLLKVIIELRNKYNHQLCDKVIVPCDTLNIMQAVCKQPNSMVLFSFSSIYQGYKFMLTKRGVSQTLLRRSLL